MPHTAESTHFLFPDPKTTAFPARLVQRGLEMIPGMLTWGTLIGVVVLSIFAPVAAAVFIIIFDTYWIYKAIYITLFTLQAQWNISEGKRIDWKERYEESAHPAEYIEKLKTRIKTLKTEIKASRGWSEWRKRRGLRQAIRRTKRIIHETVRLIPIQKSIMDWRDVVHVVLLPTAGEPVEVIEPAIESIAKSRFPLSQIVILLATEEREDPATRLPKVEVLQSKFGHLFKDFLVTTHIVETGEMKCKASNATFAAKELMKYLDGKDIDYKRVIFSNFDCDSVIHPEYFPALTHYYTTNPNRLQRAYQPLPMYHNNLWDTNALVRVVVTGSSFWHLYQSTRREMVTFSSHSEPFDTLVKVNFWPVNMISEDSVIYWKCLSY
ncbi:MAG: hypothetical protein WAT81_03450, partial [Candidatus Moraniibacteriota bacterium]